MRKYFLIFAFSIFLSSCQIINYTPIQTEKESELGFKQITNKEHKVADPMLHRNDQLYWYAAPTIDVSSDDQKLLYIKDAGVFRELFVIDQKLNKDSAVVVRMNVFDMHFSNHDSAVYFTGTESPTKLQPIVADQAENYKGGGMVEKVIVNDDYGNEYISYSGIKRFHKYPNLGIYKSTIGTYEKSKVIDTDDLDFCVSLDNDSIFYFSCGIYENFSTFSVNRNNKEVKELFNGMAGNVDSKNGVVYYAKINEENHRSEIFAYNLSTKKSKRLLSDSEVGYSTPQISNDGKKLLIVGSTPVIDEQQMNLDLYLYDLVTEDVTQLTDHIGNDLSPCWSSDDQSVYFLSQRGNLFGKYNIWNLEL